MIRSILTKLEAIARDERGLTTVEYAIVLCLIAAVAVGAWSQFGGRVHDNLQKADDKIDKPLKAALGES